MLQGLGRLDDKLSTGVALAAATDLQRPAAGSTNRVGGMVSTFGDRSAAGFGYTRQSGNADFGVAIGLGSGATMGKAGVGFSW